MKSRAEQSLLAPARVQWRGAQPDPGKQDPPVEPPGRKSPPVQPPNPHDPPVRPPGPDEPPVEPPGPKEPPVKPPNEPPPIRAAKSGLRSERRWNGLPDARLRR